MLNAEQSGEGDECEHVRHIDRLLPGRFETFRLQTEVGGAQEEGHSNCVNQPTDTEQTDSEEVDDAPRRATQVEVVKSCK